MYALVSSLVALLTVAGRGPDALRPYHLTVLGMLALYLGSGMLGGVVFGFLMPLGRRLWGAVLLGLFVTLPVAFVMVAIVSPDLHPMSGEFLWTWIAVSLLGPVVGAGLWRVNNRQ